MSKQKLFVITESFDVDHRGRVTFYALYKGKKKKWNVGKELFDLLVELEKLTTQQEGRM